MFSKRDKIREIASSEKIDIDLALNILINAACKNYNKLSNLDKWLLGKSLETFQWHYNNKVDITLKFDKSK